MRTFTTRRPHARRTRTLARQSWMLAGVAGVSVAILLCLTDGPPTELGLVAQFVIASVSTGLMIRLLLVSSRIPESLRPATKRGTEDLGRVAVEPRYWQLQQVAGVTDDLFIAWYLPFLSSPSTEQLSLITNALKRRQSRLMGTEHGHEAARQQRDRWTYAVFLVASLSINDESICSNVTTNKSGATHDLSQLLELIPDSARVWLTACPDICRCIIDALLIRSDENPIWSLLTPAPSPTPAKPAFRKAANSTADQRSPRSQVDQGAVPTSRSNNGSDTLNCKADSPRVASHSKFGALGLLRIED